ncbi:MAG: phosphatidylinositol kinase [Gammaproteobacteria bacterium RIFCSPHIGHO2_12_FULL_45_9]|nr:MAG: phosphatidylinositol kinase [Gammaproteobacteria bacterium RIFCSPHIGHO2_12_FULL_45_9]
MKRCPITYDVIDEQAWYSQRGLSLLSPQLKDLKPLPLTAAEQRKEAVARAGKMSIQGVQTKLSAQLKIKDQYFDIVDKNGHYILKTQSEHYSELPENEAITMTLASKIGIEVPVHGMVYAKDNSMTYFIKRFDRAGHRDKLSVEDFAQLSGLKRDTKYDSSMEKVASIISKFCTFPKLELVKLFKLTLFNFLTGNEDMHLKNFSLITRGRIITLSPAYDLLNSTIALENVKEEFALPLNGRKHNLKAKDFFHYFATERLGLNEVIIKEETERFQAKLPLWKELISHSFLSKPMQEKYVTLLEERSQRLFERG